MIHVSAQPEPSDFNNNVRRPGQRFLAPFLAADTKPRSKEFQKKGAFWKNAINNLHAAYNGICAYTCFYLVSPESSVDHYLPKSRYPQLAYDWSNFRLSKPRVNHHKGDSEDVVDPFIIQNGWFVLDFPSCLVSPSKGLPIIVAEQVNKTIQVLKLNQDDDFVQERCDLMLDYAEGKVSLDFLSKRYPFLAVEIVRQGIQHTANTLFKRRTV